MLGICQNLGCDQNASPTVADSNSTPPKVESTRTALKIEADQNSIPADLDDSQKTPGDLREQIAQVLDYHLRNRLMSGEVNAAWQIMHGVLAYSDRLPLQVSGKKQNTIDYLLGGGVVNGWELSPGNQLTSFNRTGMKARLEPGSYIGQGHVDQWIAILAQINQPLSRKVVARDKVFTIEDWVRQAQWDVPDNPVLEYSWTIMAIAHYFPDEPSWVAKDGKTWTLEPLAAFESQQDLANSPCGGMHRLVGLSHAVKFFKNQNPNQQVSGGWKKAADKIEDSIRRIRQFQNADGTFSTNHTERPGTSSDLSSMISSTGHTVEFLAFALEKNKLEEPWIKQAVSRLCQLLVITRDHDLECGGLYHALNGLKLYYEKCYEATDWTDLPINFVP